MIRLGPDPYWPKNGRVVRQPTRRTEVLDQNGKTDYTQPLDIEKLIDYGPLEVALKNISVQHFQSGSALS